MELSKYIGSKIREFRIQRGFDMDELANKLNTTKQTISRYELGDRKANQDVLFELSKILNVSIDDFFPKQNELLLREDRTPYNVIKTNYYDYLPAPISAGLPITVDGITEAEKIRIPDALMGKWAGHKDIFITKIFGDSMNKTMPDGSIIAVKPTPLENLKDGDIVVYSINHDYSVKRLIKQADRLVFRPHSTENCFTDQIVNIENNELLIHGKVVLYMVEMD